MRSSVNWFLIITTALSFSTSGRSSLTKVFLPRYGARICYRKSQHMSLPMFLEYELCSWMLISIIDGVLMLDREIIHGFCHHMREREERNSFDSPRFAHQNPTFSQHVSGRHAIKLSRIKLEGNLSILLLVTTPNRFVLNLDSKDRLLFHHHLSTCQQGLSWSSERELFFRDL